MYEKLTWYLPILRKTRGDRYVREFSGAVREFADQHVELTDENGPQPGPDVSAPEGMAEAARICSAVRDPHAGDGSGADPFANGTVTDLLTRLNEIDIRNARRDMIMITIKGASGYTAAEYAYQDELSVTPDLIRYHYEPQIPSDINPPQKWEYRPGPEHRQTWEDLITAVIRVLHRGASSGMFDVGTRAFMVTYADGTEEERLFFLSSSAFKECYELIEKMTGGAFSRS